MLFTVDENKPINIFCGHYGAGKTNVAVNFAKKVKKAVPSKKTLLLFDLDIVNPYFRSSDNKAELIKDGIEAIVPEFAGTNVDVPSIMPDIARIFLPEVISVLDIGGDDSGAVVLSVYKDRIKAAGYRFYYVVNKSRPFIASASDAADMLKSIETSSGLHADAIINNTNLGEETTPEIIRAGFSYAEKLSALTLLPVVATTVFTDLPFSDYEKEKHCITQIESVTKRLY